MDPKAAKKPPVKGKVEEEVAPKVETSKRKNKIREKSARDAKIESDEPTDGPDQYIMLKGFDSLTLITSMIEDQEIPISSILRAIDFPSADLKGKPYVSENEVLNTFDGFIELMRGKISIMDSYLWKSLVFVDVKGTFESVKEFYDAMAKSIYNVVYTKKTWSTYYKDNLIISVPLEKEAPMSRYYESLCDSVKERNAELIFGFLLESLCKDDISYEENALDYYLEKQLAKFINAPVSDSGLQTYTQLT